MLKDATPEFVTALQSKLPPKALRQATEGDLLEPRGSYRGRAGVVAEPACAEEVSVILRAAGAARVPVVPIAGGTGLVAGQVAPDGPLPILLSVARMTKIRAIYPEENALVAEAGAILAHVQEAAADHDRLFPLSLASEGSARIGGLLGTNAGGVNVLRYGNARDLCLGLEAVLPSGEIWHGLRRLRKDNTGYDLRNLLIGAEGTLGVITAAALRLFPRPAQEGAALFVVPSPEAALSLLSMARGQIGEAVSAFELISGQGLRFLAEKMPQVRRPFDPAPDWMVLVDLGLPAALSPSGMLEDLFATAYEAGLVSDGLIAQSQAQRQEFWTVRESIPEANRLVGAIASHDVSLPLGRVAEFIRVAQERLDRMGDYRINCFGHMGDGNLHFNAFPLPGQSKAERAQERPQVQNLIHELAAQMEGSISAEHGIGRLKAGDLARLGDPTKLGAMRLIKDALDPQGIMNPGAVLQ